MTAHRAGAADSLMEALADALDIPTAGIVEMVMHRTPAARTVITVRFDATHIEAPPLQRVYELTEYEGDYATGAMQQAITITGDIPSRRRRFWR